MSAGETFLEWGSYAAATGAIGAVLVATFRWVIGPVLAKPVAKALTPAIEEIVDSRAEPIRQKQAIVDGKVDRILGELHPNGGRSLRDRVDAQGRQLNSLLAEQVRLRDAE